MQQDGGGSVYLRLSTRQIEQPERDISSLKSDIIKGAYWAVEPEDGAEFALVYTGVLAPEAKAAFEQIKEDIPGAGLLAVTSADMLHADWMAQIKKTSTLQANEPAHIERLLGKLAPTAGMVTLVDGAPGYFL